MLPRLLYLAASRPHLYIPSPLTLWRLSIALFELFLRPSCLPLTTLSFSFSLSSMAHRSQKTVCVMDASTTLGLSLVERLLNMGYTVHAATYNHGDLKELLSDNKRLRIFRSDPFDYQSILNAVKGCAGVFYNFEPPQEQAAYDEFMVEVEVRAAHNVLEACAQTETIERIVFTSSVTAVVWKEDRKSVVDFDERDWSELNFCRKRKLWHALAKTLSERTSWAMAMDRGVDMVSINAGLLLAGPGLSPAHPYLRGAPEMYEGGVLVTVDLGFLVDAHLAIYESCSAYGRYLCFNHTVCRPEDAIKLAQALAPSAPCPPTSDDLRIIHQRLQNKKLNKLMVDLAGEMNI